MKKVAICCAINDYPGYINDLQGCLNDARSWSALLTEIYGFAPPTMLLDFQATTAAVKSAVTQMISDAEAGDHLVWTYSGHGTSIPGQRPDKPDGRAEAICLYDGLLADSEIREMLANLKPGAHMTIISDSCHSGTLSRVQRTNRFHLQAGDVPNPRYMPPEDPKFAKQVKKLETTGRVFRMINEEAMPEILLTGCKATEYSNDASLDGKYWGAFSYFAIKCLRENPQATYQDFYNKLRTYLPSEDFNQTPQLEGSAESKNRLVFS